MSEAFRTLKGEQTNSWEMSVQEYDFVESITFGSGNPSSIDHCELAKSTGALPLSIYTISIPSPG